MRKILLPFMAILLFASCIKDPTNGDDKIRICHKTSSSVKSGSIIIEINKNALPAHLAHGDVRLDDEDRDGYVPYNHCGFGKMGDCNDNNAAINPGATEISGNEIDENCNGEIGEDPIETVTICGQVWMAKNLNVSKYRNGDDIGQVTDGNTWAGLESGAWCYYGNNTDTGTTYGKLYNFYAVADPRGLAPAGWHVASDAEWETLWLCLSATNNPFVGKAVGSQLKEAGTTHWKTPNYKATNSSGFTGLPGGWRDNDGTFAYIRSYGYWWSSTSDVTIANNWVWYMYYNNAYVYRSEYRPAYGFSVRCIRD